jgi:predicted PurR-regulated permease PerM
MSRKNKSKSLGQNFTPSPDLASKIAQSLSMRLLSILLIGFFMIYLKSLLIPLVLAILLAFLLSPTIFKMNAWGLNFVVSTLLAHLLSLVLISGAIFAFTTTLEPLSKQAPKYREAIVHELALGMKWVNTKINNPKTQEALRREVEESILPKAIDQGVRVTQSGVKLTTTLLGNFFLTLLLSMFILLESHSLKEKVSEAYGDSNPLLASLGDIGLDVRAYVVAKTLTSLLTASCVYLVLWLAGVDFAFFWALITFPLNFIPTVGVVVAALPPITIAFVDPELSLTAALVVMLSLGFVNAFIGSVVEPNYVGQKVKLSALVVFLSMLLWGLLWGPVGMILAVPIMVSVKVICSHVKGLEPIAIMMRG